MNELIEEREMIDNIIKSFDYDMIDGNEIYFNIMGEYGDIQDSCDDYKYLINEKKIIKLN